MCGARFFFSVVAMHSHLYCVGQISVLCWSVSTFFTCNLLLVLSAAIIGYHYKARKIIFETICWGFQFSSSFRISVNHFEPFLRSSLPNHDLCPNTPGDSHCNQPWILAKSCPMLWSVAPPSYLSWFLDPINSTMYRPWTIVIRVMKQLTLWQSNVEWKISPF